MSLLMDALKRAEQSKRQAQGEPSPEPSPESTTGSAGSAGSAHPTGTVTGGSAGPSAQPDAPPELSLERIDATGAESRLPDLDSRLASLDADLTASTPEALAPTTSRPPASPAGKATVAAQRSSAQNVFAAKQEPAPPTNSGKRFLAIGSVGLLAAGGVGSYFYLQLQAISGRSGLAVVPGTIHVARPAATTALPNIPAAPAASPAPAAGAPAAAAPLAAVAAPPAAGPTAAQTPAAPAAKSAAKSTAKPATVLATGPVTIPASGPAAAPIAKTASPAAPKRARSAPVAPIRDFDDETPPPRARHAVAAKAGVESPAAASAPEPLRFSTQTQDSLMTRAYEALQAGKLDVAHAAYAQALRADRKNPDALVGLATVLQREGDPDGAERYFRLAIDADPRHSAAHAGLIALRGAGDPATAESRLKSLLNAQQADPAATGLLSFTLGNLYAGQRRWSEAQQAYFKAFTNDAEHPDYVYNLAVSLDHMGQAALARQYYEQALKAAQKRPAAFDQARGEKRLAELQR